MLNELFVNNIISHCLSAVFNFLFSTYFCNSVCRFPGISIHLGFACSVISLVCLQLAN